LSKKKNRPISRAACSLLIFSAYASEIVFGVTPTLLLSFNPLVTVTLAGTSSPASGVNTIVGAVEVPPNVIEPSTTAPLESVMMIVSPATAVALLKLNASPVPLVPVMVTLESA
jgi:hypothetical protein